MIGLFIFYFFLFSSSTKAKPLCGDNENEFLGKCFCIPGWDPSPASTLDNLSCTVPNTQVGPCSCFPGLTDRSFLKNDSWYYEDKNAEFSIRCTNLCKSNSQVGVPFSIPQEWHDNRIAKQLPFYLKELTIASERRRHNHLIERLDEFAEGYSQWHFLNNSNLGDVIEFGAGGYTQFRNIMERVSNVQVRSVTLIDPNLNNYKKIRSCTFQSGQVEVNGQTFPTTLLETTVEEFGFNNRMKETPQLFDTVICMNVLVYAKNAYEFLTTLLESLKPGGLLLFHDRWFEDPAQSSACKMSGFIINVIQVKRVVLDHFISRLDSTNGYLNTNQTALQKYRQQSWCRSDPERAYFVALRKPLV